MTRVQKLFDQYWKLREHKRYLRAIWFRLGSDRIQRMKYVMRAMSRTAAAIEKEIYLFPQEYRHIPDWKEVID